VVSGFHGTETRAAVIPVLLNMLMPDSPLRVETIYALGNLGDPSVLPQIRQLVEDPDENVAAAARRVVQILGGRRGSATPKEVMP
jgi:HEAT repeat protein